MQDLESAPKASEEKKVVFTQGWSGDEIPKSGAGVATAGGSIRTRSWPVDERRREFRERMVSLDLSSSDVVRVKVEVERVAQEHQEP